MDYLDYKTHNIAQSITARVYIWDLCGTPRLVRDQLLQLDEVEINLLRYEQYRRLDVAFHPASDRMAIFNVVYNLDLITSSSMEYQIYMRRTSSIRISQPDVRTTPGKYPSVRTAGTLRLPSRRVPELQDSLGNEEKSPMLWFCSKPTSPVPRYARRYRATRAILSPWARVLLHFTQRIGSYSGHHRLCSPTPRPRQPQSYWTSVSSHTKRPLSQVSSLPFTSRALTDNPRPQIRRLQVRPHPLRKPNLRPTLPSRPSWLLGPSRHKHTYPAAN